MGRGLSDEVRQSPPPNAVSKRALGDDVTLARRSISVLGAAAFLSRNSVGSGGSSGAERKGAVAQVARRLVLESFSLTVRCPRAIDLLQESELSLIV